jgi:hypothetical protein
MQCTLLLLLVLAPLARGEPWWPFSWATPPVHAFPGASSRFMNPSEVSAFAKYPMLNIWGINATCVNATSGAAIPASCRGSYCTCLGSPSPEEQRFLPLMESSLHAQARALKDAKAPAAFPILGYLNSAVMQQYSLGQNRLNTDDALAHWRMNLSRVGVVDCFKNECNYQGMEYRVLDFRIPEARAWWVENVLAPLINSPDIDGTFLDESNNFVTNLCPRWGCTPSEQAAVTAGQLALVDEALAYAASIGKWICVSLTCSKSQIPDYCDAAHQSMLRHGSGMRFYEFFQPTDLPYLAYEAQTLGLPVVAHAGARTMNPHWVELAAFLIGAGNYSYFSHSGGWTYNDFPWEPEYDMPLGAPLTPAVAVNTSTVLPPWSTLAGTSLIFALPSAPGKGGPGVDFVGNSSSAEGCAQAALGAHPATLGWTWVSADGGAWALGCYARTGPEGFNASCFPQHQAAPCNVVLQAGCTSAVAFTLGFNSTSWAREFEHASVAYDPQNGTAHITPRQR